MRVRSLSLCIITACITLALSLIFSAAAAIEVVRNSHERGPLQQENRLYDVSSVPAQFAIQQVALNDLKPANRLSCKTCSCDSCIDIFDELAQCDLDNLKDVSCLAKPDCENANELRVRLATCSPPHAPLIQVSFIESPLQTPIGTGQHVQQITRPLLWARQIICNDTPARTHERLACNAEPHARSWIHTL